MPSLCLSEKRFLSPEDIAAIFTGIKHLKSLDGNPEIWKLQQYDEKPEYTYERGFAEYTAPTPEMYGAMAAFLGHDALESNGAGIWNFRQTIFPLAFAGIKTNVFQVKPMFYESATQRGRSFGDEKGHSVARVFTLSGARTFDIANYERRMGERAQVRVVEEIDFYRMDGAPDFSYKLVKTE